MASNKKKVVLPTADQLEVVLELLKDHVLSEDAEFDDEYAYTSAELCVTKEESGAYDSVRKYLESLHPPVYKTKSVKEKVGRQGLK